MYRVQKQRDSEPDKAVAEHADELDWYLSEYVDLVNSFYNKFVTVFLKFQITTCLHTIATYLLGSRL